MKVSRLNRILLAALLAATSFACSKDGSSQSPNGMNLPDPQSKGTFNASSTSQTEPFPEQFGYSCRSADDELREYRGHSSYDPRLRAGDRFQTVLSVKDQSRLVRLKYTMTIADVSPTKITRQIYVHEAEGYKVIRSGLSGTDSCELNAKEGTDDFEEKCVSNPDYSQQDVEFKTCGVVQKLPKSDSSKLDSISYSIGTFRLTNGQTVSAYKSTKTIYGMIECDGKEIGPGMMRSVSIKSNEVVSSQNQMCGGADLFMFFRVVTEDGKVLTEVQQEALLAPVASEIK